MDKREYLTSKGFHWKEEHRPSGLNALMNCPFCDDKERKFAINLESGAFKCLHENKCGAQGSWYEFQRRLGDKPFRADGDGYFKKQNHQKIYTKPNIKDALIPLKAEGMSFLKKRGFTEDTIQAFGLKQTKDGKEIAIPYYRGGELVNVKYRGVKEKVFRQEKNAEPALFNQDKVPKDSPYLVITEGEFDCMALAQYGIQGTSVHSGVSNEAWIDNDWEYLENFKEIFLCLDSDTAGQEAVAKISKRLGRWRCKNIITPFKDLNECLINAIPREEIFNLFSNAQDFRPDILLPADYFTDAVIQLVEHPEKLSGIPTAFPSLTKILGGWRDSELSVWTGRNSAGKTTVLNQSILDTASRGIGCCIASLEMPASRYLRWIVVQYTKLQWPEPRQIRDALRTIGEKLYILDTSEEAEIDTILDAFKYAARRYGTRHFVIDSLMRVKMDTEKQLQSEKEVCSKLVSFAKEFSTHVHLVAHPRKGNDDDDIPGKVDIKGSSHITDLAHNVLVLWRPSEELKEQMRKKAKGGESIADAKLYVKKNRELGTEGGIKLWFNPATKRFRDTETM